MKKDAGSKWMFNLKAGNGEVVLTSESYASKDGALGGIASVRSNGLDDTRFERRTSAKGEPYFVLLATNKEPIGRSEMYSSAAAMEHGVHAVMRACGATHVEEV